VPRLATRPALQGLADLGRLLAAQDDFQSVLAALKRGRSATLDGAWGSSAALALGTLALDAPATVLVVLAHPRDVDAWAADLASFSGVAPAVFPASEANLAKLVDEAASQRLRLLRALQNDSPPRLVVTTIQALIQPVPARDTLAATARGLRRGDTVDLDDLAGWLVANGYRPVEAVELPGEFSRRGGILDAFSPDADAPVRLELFGDEVDSLRQFAPMTQRSLGQVNAATLVGANLVVESATLTGHLTEYLPAGSWSVLVEADELRDAGQAFIDRQDDRRGLFSVAGVFQQLVAVPSIRVSALPSPGVEASLALRVESVERFSGEVARVRDELDAVAGKSVVLIACETEAETARLSEVLAAGRLAQSDRLRLVQGRVRSGFRIVGVETVVVLGGQELFHRDARPEAAPRARRQVEARAIDSFLDLTEGDLVVHVSHGIARFRGMQLLERTATTAATGQGGTRQTEEHLILEFRDGVRLYVPASRIDLVQKYVGGSKTDPELSKLNGTAWQSRVGRVATAVRDLAVDMIQLQAVREAQTGTACPPDSEWQHQFEASFPYQDTPDQATSLVEIKSDMQRARPMDRLLCGDVGYGKTELAVRAAFKAVDNGRQVAVLVPTTVLAEQHYRTFTQRLAEYPFTVECLSRFRTAGEQRRIVQRLAAGGLDIVIGTHRLVGSDVKFKDLGLVVIDEEQRFGVEHKEKLKRLRAMVDVLTLSATPIPRTLHLALLGIRDISNLETPPPDRLAIETRIARFDEALIRHAVLRELDREGQVYFVHNRVHDIKVVEAKLNKIVPEAKTAIVHGQMTEHELEANMLAFVRRDADILIATTIIESGLDIPNANTIFIDEADIYGLADLHQLRGRVGRYRNRAYCYLLLHPAKMPTPNAARRLKAIEEFTDLGAGFKIALRDLEIRGAGNLLGTQQSGHISAVGYELYCQLLENAVREMKQQPARTPLEATVDLPWHAYLPHDYIATPRLRIEAYRRLARVRKQDKLDDFRQELADRYGPVPEVAEWLLRLTELRLLAARWKIATVHLERPDGPAGPTDVVLGYKDRKRIDALATRSAGRLRVVDDESAYFRLQATELPAAALYECLRHLLRA